MVLGSTYQMCPFENPTEENNLWSFRIAKRSIDLLARAWME